MDLATRTQEGVLSPATFPDLLYSILGRKETGVLTLTDETSEKSVYIQAGLPVFAASNNREDRLDRVFLKAGRVPLERLLAATERSQHARKRLGTILVKMDLIQPHELVEAVVTQVKDIICSLFLWTRGWYRYRPGPLPSEEVITLKLNVGKIIFEGIRRIESWDRIWEAVGGLDVRYQTADGMRDMDRDLPLSLEEWQLLAHCERPIALRAICRVSTLSDFEICRLLWALLTLGIVKKLSPPA